MKTRTLLIWNWILMALPWVATLAILPHLPEQIPAHYGFDGQVDRWGSKYEALIFPVLALVTGLLLLGIARFAGRAERSGENNRKISLLAGVVALAVMDAMTAYFLYTDLAQTTDLAALSLDLHQILFGLLGVGMILLGNGMPKLRRNAVVGLRTSWSQRSDAAWKKSQQIGGRVFLVTGALTVVLCLLVGGLWCFVGTMALLLGGTVVALWWSYQAVKGMQEEDSP